MENQNWVNKRREFVRIGPREDLHTEDQLKKQNPEFKQSVQTWIINNKGEFLMQKRSPNKKYYPNTWSQTGGGIKSGETSLEACMRECFEELHVNLEPENISFMLSFQRVFDFVDVYVAKQDIDLKDIVIDTEELSEVAYFTKEQIEEMIEKNMVASSASAYFDMLLMCLGKDFDNVRVKTLKRTFNEI